MDKLPDFPLRVGWQPLEQRVDEVREFYRKKNIPAEEYRKILANAATRHLWRYQHGEGIKELSYAHVLLEILIEDERKRDDVVS